MWSASSRRARRPCCPCTTRVSHLTWMPCSTSRGAAGCGWSRTQHRVSPRRGAGDRWARSATRAASASTRRRTSRCGEGGALAVADPDVASRAEIAREKGTNRSAFLRGQVDKYTWVAEGSSYVLSDVLAAILEVQLEKVGNPAGPPRRDRGPLPGRTRGVGGQPRREAASRARRPHPQPPHLPPALSRRPRARRRARGPARRRDHGHIPLRAAALLAARQGDRRRCLRTAGDGPRRIHAAAPAAPCRAVRRRRGPRGRGRQADAREHDRRRTSAWSSPATTRRSTWPAASAEIRETLEQTRWPFEIIFVDDVSRDRTREMLRADRRVQPAAEHAAHPAREEPGRGGDSDATASEPRAARSRATSTSTSRSTAAISRRSCAPSRRAPTSRRCGASTHSRSARSTATS